MEPSLINRYIRLPTTKDVWEAVEKTFYDDSDETRIFELNKKCFAARQNGRPLPTYYNELVGMFQEIDQRIASQNNTVAGVVQETTAMARMRVHMFLSGLDSEYDQVYGEILRKDQKFTLKQSYTYVRKNTKLNYMLAHVHHNLNHVRGPAQPIMSSIGPRGPQQHAREEMEAEQMLPSCVQTPPSRVISPSRPSCVVSPSRPDASKTLRHADTRK
ncbi:hypothetical protein ACLB2K_073139 [Fragaria x ananassa]